MPSLPDYLSEDPLVDEIAFELRLGTGQLRTMLRNQQIYVNPGERIPRGLVFTALEAELAAGRGWKLQTLERF